ncbi:MAG: hypothetical protein KJ888_20360 [Gammaproteobacteria bacterium]|uniref:Uncharacterized protein n=1 Tax=viral metagenome TaxID=1070528 RepID=A0A6M3L1H3_9ZZZZ|nr:hypothetical protein [Gammaproteobacteria bacterium]MBU2685644.1 hypothetical protein [Gammaproteobacteria bacterium]
MSLGIDVDIFAWAESEFEARMLDSEMRILRIKTPQGQGQANIFFMTPRKLGEMIETLLKLEAMESDGE